MVAELNGTVFVHNGEEDPSWWMHQSVLDKFSGDVAETILVH